MKKILIPVHTGYEETELIATLDVLSRNKVDYILWSVEGLDTVKSSHEALVKTKILFPAEVKFDAIFIPGGSTDLLDYDEILHLVQKFDEEEKVVAAICAGPAVLEKAGVLEGKTYTAHPGYVEGPNKLNKDIVVDGNIITARDFEATINFAKTLIEELNRK